MRYDSARAVRDDLERFTSGARTTAEEQGWPERVLDQEADATDRTACVRADEEATSTDTSDRASALGYGGTRGELAFARAAAGGSGAFAPVAPSRTTSASRSCLGCRVDSSLFGLTTNECSVAGDARRVAAAVSTRELDQLGDGMDGVRKPCSSKSSAIRHVRLERSLTATHVGARRPGHRQLSHGAADGERGAVAIGARRTGARDADRARRPAASSRLPLLRRPPAPDQR